MGYKQKKDTPPMERELKYLLADLCIKWGFCISSEEINEISTAESYRAQDFAEDVVAAEGMDYEGETKWVRNIAERFKIRFGTDSIDVSTFVDRVRGQKEIW
jgi:hypothetical protein